MTPAVQGLESYSYDELVDIVGNYIVGRLSDCGYATSKINDGSIGDDVIIKDIKLHGSRLRWQARDDSDLDAVVEYDGNIREDDLFDLLNDEDPLYIEDIRVDINPIKEDMYSYMIRSNKYDKHRLGLENKSTIKGDKMIRKYEPTLEERIARLERAVNERRKPTNEVAPIVAKIAPLILKNLPLILSMLPDFIDALKSDQLNDNSENIKTLQQFGELGKKVGEMFSNMK